MDAPSDTLMFLEALNIKPNPEMTKAFHDCKHSSSSIPSIHSNRKIPAKHIKDTVALPYTLYPQVPKRAMNSSNSTSDSVSSTNLLSITMGFLTFHGIRNLPSTDSNPSDSSNSYPSQWIDSALPSDLITFCKTLVSPSSLAHINSFSRLSVLLNSFVIDNSFELFTQNRSDFQHFDYFYSCLSCWSTPISQSFFISNSVLARCDFEGIYLLYSTTQSDVMTIIRRPAFVFLISFISSLIRCFIERSSIRNRVSIIKKFAKLSQKCLHLLNCHGTCLSVAIIVLRISVISLVTPFAKSDFEEVVDGFDEFIINFIDQMNLYRQPGLKVPLPTELNSFSSVVFFRKLKQFKNRSCGSSLNSNSRFIWSKSNIATELFKLIKT
ncbi:hypothetical protein P9112_004300 [Eukaryota sp. TZLM1-RC]